MTNKDKGGLNIGDQVRNFSAVDLHDEIFQLGKELKKGPIVIVFYRGQWCPICNKHLKNLEKQLEGIKEKGAQLVAVSPEKSEFLKRTSEKTKANFRLLHDEDYHISNIFDVTIQPGKLERFMVNTILGAKLKKANTDSSERLPIPATFIIDPSSKVVWRHFNPDYKKRSKPEEIIENIPIN